MNQQTSRRSRLFITLAGLSNTEKLQIASDSWKIGNSQTQIEENYFFYQQSQSL